ncbi:MAG: alpha/beta-type small acid-soluble spore protein [Clostridia bacterium]|nr:alpha/beta-type small acid-soluble spore protein [Clostridia bacterium]
MASNNMSNKQAKAALDKFKYEVANELGINLKQGYNGDLTSREAGSIGGEMVKKLVAQAANQMQSKQ